MVGGGKTTVTQQAAAASDVIVNITNDISTEAIAQVLAKFGLTAEATNEILKSDVATRQAQILLMMNGQTIEADKTATIKKVANIALAGTACYLVYKGIKK